MKKLSKADLVNRIRSRWNVPISLPRVFGVPRGGWGIAAILEELGLAVQVDTPEEAEVIVDDIIDSGKTRCRIALLFPDTIFWAPYDKTREGGIPWLVFPWEGSAQEDGEEMITRILQFIGEDPNRPGLLETPKRVVKSWGELFSGYKKTPEEVLGKVFDSDCDEMVICRDIEFYSTCEHHMIPFFGTVSIGYIPRGKVVGLSKLARLVEIYSRRLQIQEQFTQQIASAIMKYVPEALGAGVVVRAKHMCMCGRGVSKQGSSMVTSAMLGAFRQDATARSEFLRLIGKD